MHHLPEFSGGWCICIYVLIGFAQPFDKLEFVEYLLSLRASAHTGVAIPRLEGKCADKHPKNGSSRDFWW